MTVLEAARAYVAAGLSVIPIELDGTKRPDFQRLPSVPDPKRDDRMVATWRPFQERLPTDKELVAWFGKGKAGIAIIGGAVSGGAECIDFDDAQVGDEFFAAVKEERPDLFAKLTRIETGRGSAHCWYRCAEIDGNHVLAQRPATAEELAAKPHEKSKTLIETRGEGGYAIAPGSPVEVHASKRPYKRVAGPKLTQLVEIDCEERDWLLRLARSYHRGSAQPRKAAPGPLSPADDFDLRGQSFGELLGGTGAEVASGSWDEGKLRRPGKEKGWSATVGFCKGGRGEPLLHVFSSSWPPFEANKTYGRYHVLRLLKFDGDGAAALRWCREQGFGDRVERNGKHETNGKHEPQRNGVHKPQTVEVHEPEPWDQPIPLEDFASEVPTFPVEALPVALGELVQSIAAAVNCPPDYAAVYALGVAAGTIGARYSLEVKPGYIETTNCYLCVVALAGGGKTPSIEPIARPVYHEQQRRKKEGDDRPAYVGDTTVEKLVDLMKKDERGQLMINDEMSAWINGLNQYKKSGGNDRQKYLSMWSGEPVSVHRKDPESPEVFVAYPRLTIVGGIQPKVLDRLRGDTDDGFFDRILFSWPREHGMEPENWLSAPAGQVEAWAGALRRIRELEMKEGEHGPRPFFLKLNASGRGAWEEWTGQIAKRVNAEDFPGYLRGPAVKIRGYCARIALVLHVLREAYGESGGMTVGRDDVNRAAAICRYFLAHAGKVYRSAGRDERVETARIVLNWIATRSGDTFKRSEAWDSLRRNAVFTRPEDLTAPLKFLQMHNWIRWLDLQRNGNGRPSSPTYQISPFVRSPINPINPENPANRMAGAGAGR